MGRTFYDVLMISPLADSRFMTVAYRHLAKRYHPDVDPSPQAAARMAELNEAYAILSDSAKRAVYDEMTGLRASRPTLGPGGEPFPAELSSAGAAGAPPASSPYGEAGAPPGHPFPSGAALTFGRYRGWTLNQVAHFDRDYLEWLSRTTMGRNYRHELDELLRRG
jgi:DnaJ-class molecular chaperone